MNIDNTVIHVARKYAQALLNVYSDSITYDDIKHIERIGFFMKTHPALSIFFKLSIDDGNYKDMLMDHIKRFDFPEYMHSLLEVLFGAQRLFLLPEICRWIGIYFRRKHSIVEFRITTPQPLSILHKQKIEKFLATTTQGSIETIYLLDPTLIAGIRMQSKTHVWEKSIAQQLRDVQLKGMR